MILFYQGNGLELKNYGGIVFENGKYYDVPPDLYSYLKANYNQVFSSKRVPPGEVVLGLKDAKPQPMSSKDFKPGPVKKDEKKTADKKPEDEKDPAEEEPKTASSVEEL